MNPQRKVFSVSQLNREARVLLEKNLSTLWVEGEISNLSRPASGHIYFTLKDGGAQIRCAMFRNRLNYLRFRPENGAQVQVRGSVSLYEARGDYQLIAEHMEVGGEGALQQAYERLKRELKSAGLFDADHKQEIPSFPQRVGIITSPSGAAIHDILTVLERRFPALPIVLYPTAVQGERAAGEIIAAIAQARMRQECEVLILARGGGSIEDLWSFNEASVAQAIYHCPLPIISAIGHETDFTIADFVADQRAPTPSAAAELISPDHQAWLQALEQLELRLTRQGQNTINHLALRLHGIERRLRHPKERICQFSQRLDESEQRLQRALLRQFSIHSQQLHQATQALYQQSPGNRILNLRQRLDGFHHQINQAIHHKIQHYRDQLSGIAHTLDALSPLSTLSRGYSITTTQDRQVVRNTEQLQPGEAIRTRLHKGIVVSEVIEVMRQ